MIGNRTATGKERRQQAAEYESRNDHNAKWINPQLTDGGPSVTPEKVQKVSVNELVKYLGSLAEPNHPKCQPENLTTSLTDTFSNESSPFAG